MEGDNPGDPSPSEELLDSVLAPRLPAAPRPSTYAARPFLSSCGWFLVGSAFVSVLGLAAILAGVLTVQWPPPNLFGPDTDNAGALPASRSTLVLSQGDTALFDTTATVVDRASETASIVAPQTTPQAPPH